MGRWLTVIEFAPELRDPRRIGVWVRACTIHGTVILTQLVLYVVKDSG